MGLILFILDELAVLHNRQDVTVVGIEAFSVREKLRMEPN